MAKKSSKKKAPQYRTPRGVAHWPRLNTPDYGYHKFGTYKADIRLSAADAQPLIDHLQEIAKENLGYELPVADGTKKKKGKFRPNEDDNNCFYPDFDAETGELSGDWVFRMRVKNYEYKDRQSGETKLWDRKPKMFSASGKPVPNAKVGGGTEYAVVYEIYIGKTADDEPFMSMQPVAVQIYKLVEFSAGSNVDTSMIETEEGGWEPDEDEGEDLIENGSDEDEDNSPVEGEDDF